MGTQSHFEVGSGSRAVTQQVQDRRIPPQVSRPVSPGGHEEEVRIEQKDLREVPPRAEDHRLVKRGVNSWKVV